MTLRTLFLQAPSFDGYDGGAGARYQMKREVKSFWYPTWLAQPAALVEGSKLIDAPAHDQSWDDIKHEVDDRDPRRPAHIDAQFPSGHPHRGTDQGA